MAAILQGIRVIDWGMWYVGPGAAALLADMGADVIHVEQRGLGDQMRGLHTIIGTPQMLPGGRQVTFEYGNRNKRGISLDMSKAEGREVIYRLVAKSDIFLTNFRESSARALGLGYEDLKKHNPQILYLSASCFGPKGPDSGLPGLDMVAAARSGLMMISGDEDVEELKPGEPVLPPIGVADEMGAVMLAFAALGGIIARDRLGISQEVHVSQLGAMSKLLGFLINQNLLLGVSALRQKRTEARNPLYNLYRCRDGKWLALGLLREKEWGPFCQAVGLEHLEEDPRFATPAQRAQHCRGLIAILDQTFLNRNRDGWIGQLRAADLMFAPVNSLADLKDDPQMIANEYITTMDHPSLGKINFPGFPVHFSQTPMTLRSPAPEYGQHNMEVLTDVCGYAAEEVARLYEIGVL